MFGLPDSVISLLRSYFSSKPEVVKVVIFGSRAKGSEQPGSDIDLAVVTTSSADISGKIRAELDDLPTPYLFDVVDYSKITSSHLREHIDRVGKLLFRR